MLPIVLIHGFPYDSSMWDAQAKFLRSKGHRVITPHLPGFGGTPGSSLRDGVSPHIEDFAEHVHGVIQREAGGRAIVGGFSMGGYTLFALLREHPEDVAAAMLIDTRAGNDSTEARDARFKSIADVETHGTTAVIETLLARQLAKKHDPLVEAQARQIMARQTPEAIIAAQTAMAKRRDQTDLLAGLTIPVLILVGAEDAITPPSVALAMQSHIAHAMLVQIAAAGHMAPLEQPAAVNSAIDSFLATLHETA